MRDESGTLNEWTEKIIGAAIEVHRGLGPGLLESTYEECVCHELGLQRVPFERQVALPVTYKGVRLESGLRIDLVVANCVVVELKSVDRVLPVHEAQLLTYLRIARLPVGLLINFNVTQLRHGITRRVCTPQNQ